MNAKLESTSFLLRVETRDSSRRRRRRRRNILAEPIEMNKMKLSRASSD